ncbi:aminoglycoside phosphotransferase family protein [Paenibacillus sp. 32352]|uniref:aminoglycoside phosphotransferase family protein n=1 Tax=Paenibacillus sp. 32352 TaxID=1969111 RepID=UPI0009AEEB52|nr:aminoglycoside phosphotransferase family protein [Paenibacillus sp. 32352]
MSLWPELEARHGIQITGIKKVRDVYRLKTLSHGYLCLKGYKVTEDEMRFITHVLQYLESAGFDKSPRVLPAEDQVCWHTWESGHYTLTNWVIGRHPDMTSRSDFKKTVRTLAKFHRHAAAFPEGIAPESRIRYGRQTEQLAEYIQLLQSYKGMEHYIALCNIVMSDLRQPGIVRAIEQEQAQRTFVHGDYNYPNLIINSTGRLQMIDFENTSLHLRMQDLSHVLHRNFPWQARSMLRWIEYYDSKRTISKEERLLLRLMLLTPYPVVRSLRLNQPLNRLDPPLPSGRHFERYIRDLDVLL